MSGLGKVVEVGPLQLQAVEVYFAMANVETPVPHELSRAPLGSTPLRVSRGCKIWEGTTPPAVGALHLICDTADVWSTILVVAVNVERR